jgi:MFS family permease
MSEATAPQSSTTRGDVKRAARYASYFFFIMFLANFVNYLQRFAFTGLSKPITSDLKLNPAEFGLLGTIFFLVYTIFALPLGFLADRTGRKIIVGWGMALASLATIFTGLFSSFALLIGAKSLFGLGQSGFYPAGTPLLAAEYAPSRRARLIGVWTVGALIGAGVGYLSGTLLDIFPSLTWRSVLFLTAIPGFIIAAFVLLLREKKRHEEDPPVAEIAGPAPSIWQRLRSYLRVPTFRVIVALHAMGFFAITGIAFWLPLYLANTYGKTVTQYDFAGNNVGEIASPFGVAGLSPGLLATLAGAVVLLGGVFGNLYSGRLARRLSLRTPNARVLAGGVGFLLAAPFVVLTVGAPFVLPLIPPYASASPSTQLLIGLLVFIAFGLPASFCLNIYNGPTSAALLDVIPAAERGAANGTELFLAHLLGDVFSPVLIGLVAVFFTVQFGGDRIGLALLILAPIALVLSGLVGIWGSRFYSADVEKLGSTAEAMTGTAAAVK